MKHFGPSNRIRTGGPGISVGISVRNIGQKCLDCVDCHDFKRPKRGQWTVSWCQRPVRYGNNRWRIVHVKKNSCTEMRFWCSNWRNKLASEALSDPDYKKPVTAVLIEPENCEANLLSTFKEGVVGIARKVLHVSLWCGDSAWVPAIDSSSLLSNELLNKIE